MKSANFTPPLRTHVPAPSTALNVSGSHASCMLTITSLDARVVAALLLELSAFGEAEMADGPSTVSASEAGTALSPQPIAHDSATQPAIARIDMRLFLLSATAQATGHCR